MASVLFFAGASSAQGLAQDPEEARDSAKVRDPLKVYRDRIAGFKRGKGGRKYKRAVEKGLDWLASQQSPVGYWNCSDHGGNAKHHVGVTGLALLSFLGAGHGPDSEEHGETVVRTLKFLLQQQKSLGGTGGYSGNHPESTYEHAICTAAMVEAYALSGRRDLRDSAEKAIQFIYQLQNPYGGWRYTVLDGSSDSSITGWMLMALKSARLAGLEVSSPSANNGVTFLKTMMDPKTFRVGYVTAGSPPARLAETAKKFPHDQSESLTAVSLAVRLHYGENEKSAPIQGMKKRLLDLPPVWEEPRIDMYYWYYGAMATELLGGSAWTRWKKAIDKVILPKQIEEGVHAGSWDAAGAWGSTGGRIYSTAMMVMILEVPYRY